MKIPPVQIEQTGPGIDLSEMSDGLSVKMSDPVEDFAYARNAVTLLFDLSACEHVRLTFEAMEFGDEPHAPPASPFAADVAFDGVAISADGAGWYELQDLRHLRSDRFTAYDLDLDAALAQWGLLYGSAFQVRFCQVDNNPAPMDGIFIHRIEVTAELRAPVLHLPMDDNALDPTVRDTAAGGRDQVFIDPTGNPNTAAHSVPGPRGTTALAFDGADDRIDFGPALLGEIVGADCDFSLAFWFRTEADCGAVSKYVLRRAGSNAEPYLKIYLNSDRICWQVRWSESGYVSLFSTAGMLNGQWHCVVCRRRGQSLSLWVDGVARDSETGPDYARTLFADAWDTRAIGQIYGTTASDWPFAMADLQAYDRAITDEEIVAMSQ